MDRIKSVEENLKLLLVLLSISYALYLLVAFDIITTYEIFADLALLATLMASIGFIITILATISRTRKIPKSSIFYSTCAIALCYFITFSYRNGMFEGEKVIDAAFLDDRSRMDLELYKNGKYIIYSNWMFGEERFNGKYKLQGDTIKFLTSPVTDNDFIAQEAIIDRKEKKIYFRKNSDGSYMKDFYYFQIDF